MYDPNRALLELGLVDYVWGNPSTLSTWNSNLQADRARKEQQDYNTMWKEIELVNAANERAKIDALNRKEREAKLAELYRQYNNAGGDQERALIKKQIRALEGGDQNVESEMLAAFNADKKKAEDDAKQEALRHSEALKEMGELNSLLRSTKKAAEKEALAATVYDEKAYPNMNRDERDKMYAQIMGIQTLGEKIKAANEGAAAGHSGKKTSEVLDWNDIRARASQPGYVPSSEDKAIAKKNGYFWDKKLGYVEAK